MLSDFSWVELFLVAGTELVMRPSNYPRSSNTRTLANRIQRQPKPTDGMPIGWGNVSVWLILRT